MRGVYLRSDVFILLWAIVQTTSTNVAFFQVKRMLVGFSSRVFLFINSFILQVSGFEMYL